MARVLSEFLLDDMCIRYTISASKCLGLEIIPRDLMDQDYGEADYKVDSLVQIRCEGDDFPMGFANGHTLRNSETMDQLNYSHQEVIEEESNTTIRTILEDPRGYHVEHILMHTFGMKGLAVKTICYNDVVTPLTLEMISSFSLGGMTSLHKDNEARESLVLHRLRSGWSKEGRVESQTIEALQLEPSWSQHSMTSEKFGQIGSLPVRKYFPFLALEDTSNHVTWAVQLACPSSWQMEVYRRDNNLVISGGIADHDFGHWCKSLNQGDYFESPMAYITVCSGGLDEASQRITSMLEPQNSICNNPQGLPVIFNEFCTTWGSPSADNINQILEIIKDKDMDYMIIDAGWYADPIHGWESNMGDWEVSQALFPNGLKTTVEAIRNAGLKPGIWFELEICGKSAKAYHFTNHLLKRKGQVITVGGRRFWDMRDPWTINYLTEKVINLLKDYGFDYLKIDYNESIGVGCDGDDSLGEGLRNQILATQAFFRKIRQAIPHIAIELCASGGHRLEASMMALGDMASFSDAHEELEIPIIAANVQRAILPKQSQIWSVIRKGDDDRRLVYSIVNTFLGVMCISGDVYNLNQQQWGIVEAGIAFYRRISPIIQKGRSYFYGSPISSYRKPKGWQAVVRYKEDYSEVLVVMHRFASEGTIGIDLPLLGEYTIKGSYSARDIKADINDRHLLIAMKNDFEAMAIHLSI